MCDFDGCTPFLIYGKCEKSIQVEIDENSIDMYFNARLNNINAKIELTRVSEYATNNTTTVQQENLNPEEQTQLKLTQATENFDSGKHFLVFDGDNVMIEDSYIIK